MPESRTKQSISAKPALPCEHFYNEFEAAPYLDMSVHTLRNQRRLGIGPQYLKIGPNVRYTKKLMDEFLKGCLIKTKVA